MSATGACLQWSFWFAGLMDTEPDDRMYDCLPLYHSVGGVVATGAMLVRGGSVVIRERFSARHFWDDVVEGDCTIFQYIGELCRYLVNAPEHPSEAPHRLRLCCGNGLHGRHLEEFQDRFAIPRILEFYAPPKAMCRSTSRRQIGSIGRFPPSSPRLSIALVQIDRRAGRPARDDARFLRPLRRERSGRSDRANRVDAPGPKFEGYTTADTQQKFCATCSPRRSWFRTGDLMRKERRLLLFR